MTCLELDWPLNPCTFIETDFELHTACTYKCEIIICISWLNVLNECRCNATHVWIYSELAAGWVMVMVKKERSPWDSEIAISVIALWNWNLDTPSDIGILPIKLPIVWNEYFTVIMISPLPCSLTVPWLSQAPAIDPLLQQDVYYEWSFNVSLLFLFS